MIYVYVIYIDELSANVLAKGDRQEKEEARTKAKKESSFRREPFRRWVR